MGGAKVSVLIPTYNRAHYVPECVESVLKQTRPPEQVIVINDGSTDRTREVLEKYGGRIEYLEKKNRGKASALNHGLSHVRGDYVWMMDDDDIAFPDALQQHLEVLERDPRLGWTYSKCLQGRVGSDGSMEQVRLRYLPDYPEDELLPQILERNFIMPPAMLVRTECFRKVGGFDPSLTRCETLDFTVRLAREYPARRVDVPTYFYRMHCGLRGSANENYSFDDRQKPTRLYARRIATKYRAELSLSEYLPRGSGEKPLQAIERRRAYLQRMAIMANKELHEEAKEDLQLALREAPGERLSEAERSILYRLVNEGRMGDPIFPPEFLREIREHCREPAGKAIQDCLTQYLCRCGYGSAKTGRMRDSRRFFEAAASLGGVGVMARVAVAKLGRTFSGRRELG